MWLWTGGKIDPIRDQGMREDGQNDVVVFNYHQVTKENTKRELIPSTEIIQPTTDCCFGCRL